MTSLAKRGVANLRALTKPSGSVGWLATHTATAKKEGDISSVFVSLSGAAPSQLPERFAGIKRQLIREKEDRIADSWRRLLKQLSAKNDVIAKEGPNNIPRIEYGDLGSPSENVVREIRAKGVAVVRGVIPVEEARGYKAQVDEYVKANPKTKGPYHISKMNLELDAESICQHFPLTIHRCLNCTGLHRRSRRGLIPISSRPNASS